MNRYRTLVRKINETYTTIFVCVPAWKPGVYFGIPARTVPPGAFVCDPESGNFYAFCDLFTGAESASELGFGADCWEVTGR